LSLFFVEVIPDVIKNIVAFLSDLGVKRWPLELGHFLLHHGRWLFYNGPVSWQLWVSVIVNPLLKHVKELVLLLPISDLMLDAKVASNVVGLILLKDLDFLWALVRQVHVDDHFGLSLGRFRHNWSELNRYLYLLDLRRYLHRDDGLGFQQGFGLDHRLWGFWHFVLNLRHLVDPSDLLIYGPHGLHLHDGYSLQPPHLLLVSFLSNPVELCLVVLDNENRLLFLDGHKIMLLIVGLNGHLGLS
jgi:hypothetical protein